MSPLGSPRLTAVFAPIVHQHEATVLPTCLHMPAVVNIANIATKRAYLSTDLLRLPQGQGSGFLWDDQGHVVTNYHVIRGASEVRVTLIDQSVYSARLVGGDPSRDIAVLQLDAPPASLAALKAVEVGKSSGLAVGQKVYAIGNPFGLDHTLTSGIISGLNRELGAGTNNGPSLRNVIQTDAAINPGNSGGPLLDSKGRLIGINTAIADPTGKGASSGIGFAIPIDACRGLVDQILTYGRVVRPMLGITLAPPQALRQLGLSGVLVLDVPPGGPADAAGVKGTMRDGFGRVVLGDVIVGVNGRKVANEGDLFDALDSCKVGDEVRLDILSGGRTKASLSIVLAERAARVTE
ncbi:Protease Do-like 1, chloroplastic [Auxenochlorella protothecoides]|uniref:Protease Do-like 1, chloroplastic n=1 Tax=Auxenochlorella protothecoides TaxID=3075 RepID=A0A087SAH1_AUXPR|nr:Protease Do-like 1, chloroplastic [Auxenochlorella protothecoides]KFM22725.1 Protease Do-like 1, chloroplastic [Auxenochlorella protothecoides]